MSHTTYTDHFIRHPSVRPSACFPIVRLTLFSHTLLSKRRSVIYVLHDLIISRIVFLLLWNTFSCKILNDRVAVTAELPRVLVGPSYTHARRERRLKWSGLLEQP